MERPEPAYDGNQKYVFISYSHADKELVYPEIRWLQDQGVNVWYDEGISGASRWRDAIAGRISRCDLFVIYLSASSAASRVCREELDYALDQDRQILGVYLEPVQLSDGTRLAISNRQALMRHELSANDYQRKFWAAISSQLQIERHSSPGDLPVIRSARRITLRGAGVAALLSLVIGAVGAFVLLPKYVPAAQEFYRFDIVTTDPVVRFAENDIGQPLPGFTLTNSGSHLIYVGEKDGEQNLYQRSMRTGEVRMLAGTENASLPLVSPDDDWVAFLDDDTFYKVPAGGGRRIRLATTESVNAATWSLPDRLAVVHEDSRRRTLIGSDNGALDAYMEGAEYWPPSILLLNGGTKALSVDDDGEVIVLDSSSGEHRLLGMSGIFPVVREGYVFAVTLPGISAARIDEERAELTSPVVTIELPVRIEVPVVAHWSLAKNGLLVYAPGEHVMQEPLAWGDAQGRMTPLPYDRQSFGTFSLSPDGRMIAVQHFSLDNARSSVWLHDVDDSFARPVSDEGLDPALMLEWLPDSSGFYVSGFQSGSVQFHEVGTASLQDVSTEIPGAVNGVGGGGSLLVVWVDEGIALYDRANGESTVIAEEPTAWGAQVSPDGTGVAYTSGHAGSYQVFYIPVGSPEKVIQISRRPGSEEPRWNHDGTRLFYRSGKRIMVVDRMDPAGVFGRPRVFFEGNFVNMSGRSYDINADESAVLVLARSDPRATLLHVETNWLNRVERLIQEAEARGR